MKIPLSSEDPIIPFFTNAKDESVVKKNLQNSSNQPSWLKEVNSCWTKTNKPLIERKSKQSKVIKLNVKTSWNTEKNFFLEKKRIETEMRDLFNFLENMDIFGKINLIEKLNLKISSGEIIKVEQLRSFYEKAKELADCIKLFLLKNEYNENFMRKISVDVFENGFNAQKK